MNWPGTKVRGFFKLGWKLALKCGIISSLSKEAGKLLEPDGCCLKRKSLGPLTTLSDRGVGVFKAVSIIVIDNAQPGTEVERGHSICKYRLIITDREACHNIYQSNHLFLILIISSMCQGRTVYSSMDLFIYGGNWFYHAPPLKIMILIL